MTKTVTDFSAANDEIIGQLAEKLRNTHTFNARKQTGTDGVEQIKIKVLDKFNYVTHVYFRTSDNDTLQSCTCDGSGRYCGKIFCEHCKAAYDYLKSTGVFPVFLPDEQQETTLTQVEWSASRTGLINPVAIFEPVELEGTTVRRASVHNVSIVRALQLGIGDRLTVYKANMIIPQIAENLTRSGTLEIPCQCPVCGGKTEIRREIDTEVLVCTNPDCAAKKIKAFTLFASRSAMNIEGLSEMTLEKFIAAGYIHEFADIYRLEAHRDSIVEMEGFGEKSYNRLWESVEKSRSTTMPRLVYALGITGIGAANARVLCDHFGDDLQAIASADAETLSGVGGIGPVLAASVSAWFQDEKNREVLGHLLQEVHPQKRAGLTAASPGSEASGDSTSPAGGSSGPSPIAGKTFVVTGKVDHFPNRDALKEYIADRGGKVTGSVSAKTDYLINNDVSSTSSKNKKAAQLGIPILSETDFLKLAGEAADRDPAASDQ